MVSVLSLLWIAERANFYSRKGNAFMRLFWIVLTQIWWFVRRSCIRQQSIQLLPFQSVVKGLLFAEGGEGPFCTRLGFWCFKHFSVWNGVHARYMQIAAVICSLASIGWNKGRHPAPIWVAQCFTFLCAIGEEIHACKHERKKNYTYKLQHHEPLLTDKKDYAKTREKWKEEGSKNFFHYFHLLNKKNIWFSSLQDSKTTFNKRNWIPEYHMHKQKYHKKKGVGRSISTCRSRCSEPIQIKFSSICKLMSVIQQLKILV